MKNIKNEKDLIYQLETMMPKNKTFQKSLKESVLNERTKNSTVFEQLIAYMRGSAGTVLAILLVSVLGALVVYTVPTPDSESDGEAISMWPGS